MRKGPLAPEKVLDILLSDEPGEEIARRIPCCRQTVYDIRRGRIYADLFPEIQRSLSSSCKSCTHWGNDRCGLEFPDAILTGPSFARLCSAYVEVGR